MYDKPWKSQHRQMNYMFIKFSDQFIKTYPFEIQYLAYNCEFNKYLTDLLNWVFTVGNQLNLFWRNFQSSQHDLAGVYHHNVPLSQGTIIYHTKIHMFFHHLYMYLLHRTVVIYSKHLWMFCRLVCLCSWDCDIKKYAVPMNCFLLSFHYQVFNLQKLCAMPGIPFQPMEMANISNKLWTCKSVNPGRSKGRVYVA